MLEKDLVSKIIKYLRGLDGCFCWKEHGGMYGTAGIPDIIACIGGRFIAFEVKTDSGKTSKLQDIAIRNIKKAGGIAVVVRTVDEVKIILKGLKI